VVGTVAVATAADETPDAMGEVDEEEEEEEEEHDDDDVDAAPDVMNTGWGGSLGLSSGRPAEAARRRRRRRPRERLPPPAPPSLSASPSPAEAPSGCQAGPDKSMESVWPPDGDSAWSE
jgi:hypothetical protein